MANSRDLEHFKKFLQQPLSPVKKAIYETLFNYLIVDLPPTNAINFFTRNIEDRQQNIEHVLTFVNLSDDAFIANMNHYLDNVLVDQTSRLRRQLQVAVVEAEVTLTERRRQAKVGLGLGGLTVGVSAGFTLAVCSSSMLTGIPLMIVCAACFTSIGVVASKKSKDLLERWDHAQFSIEEKPQGSSLPYLGYKTSYPLLRR